MDSEKMIKRLVQVNQQIKDIVLSKINDEPFTGSIEIVIDCNKGNISGYRAQARQIFQEKKI
jgi:hypothetical protein